MKLFFFLLIITHSVFCLLAGVLVGVDSNFSTLYSRVVH